MTLTTYYTINPSTLDIIDVSRTSSSSFDVTGVMPVKVASGVGIHNNPQTLDDLITAKADGILSRYPGYNAIVLDPCLGVTQTPSVPGFDTGASSRILYGAGLTNHCVLPSGQLFTLSFTLPYIPAAALFVWEIYSTSISESSPGIWSRQRTELPTDTGSFQFQGVANFGGSDIPLEEGVAITIAPADQGISLDLNFTNSESIPVYLGSWAILLGAETEIVP